MVECHGRALLEAGGEGFEAVEAVFDGRHGCEFVSKRGAC